MLKLVIKLKRHNTMDSTGNYLIIVDGKETTCSTRMISCAIKEDDGIIEGTIDALSRFKGTENIQDICISKEII